VLLSRDPTLDTSAEYQNGILVRVTAGPLNMGTWQYTGISNPVMGTTALPWTKVSTARLGRHPSAANFLKAPGPALWLRP
jgi:hypothetical protein